VVYKRKTWKEKLEKKMEPKIVDDPKGRGRMLVPTPKLVYSLVKRFPKGKLVTVQTLRDKLAKDFGADFTCPLATGWFIRIVAEYCEEEIRVRGKSLNEVAPYWRILNPDGSLYKKFPGGVELQAKRLQEEGFKIISKRKKLFVENFEKYLWDFSQLKIDNF